MFLQQITLHNIPVPEREYRFHPVRRWRFDFAFIGPYRKLAVEIEGGTWGTSRHTTATGFHNDCEKYNTAALMGWTVFRFDSNMVRSGEAVEFLKKALSDTK